jgi:beta-lactamase class D
MIATRRFLPAFLAACLLAPCAMAEVAPLPAIKEQPAFGKHFDVQGLTGTFVLLDPETNTLHAWNPIRAKERFIPASTFKIANSLIGLETGTVKNLDDEVLPYGGKPQPFKEWEHDMPLREAMKLSAVPIYQELARRIGAEKMAAGVKSLDYGNADTSGAIDRFWLDGPLKISAVEQTAFIRRLLADDLPLKKETMQQVRGIIPTETAGDAVIHFKTGWCTSTEPNIGWIVGWVERGGKNMPFALNIDMKDMEDAPKRLALVKACLSEVTPAQGSSSTR